MKREPIYEYFKEESLNGKAKDGHVVLEKTFRTIRHRGREGLHAESIYSRLMIPKHTLNNNAGSLTLWCMCLEDMGCQAVPLHMPDYEEHTQNYVLMTDDCLEFQEETEASFALVYRFNWNDQLFAKFYKGKTGRGALYPQHAITVGGQMPLRKNVWYQIGLTWDREQGKYLIYMNGIRISSATIFQDKINHPCGRYLYMGNPSFVFSNLKFYDEFMEDHEFRERFEEEGKEEENGLQEELKRIHEGSHLAKGEWHPDESWVKKVELALNRPEDLERFYIQGCKEAAEITPEGLMITTHMLRTEEAIREKPNAYDPDQVYFWLRDWLEGDLAVEYEFMPLKENGLSLLMVQASGMHREDFMKDYPLRTTGSMRMVHGENVRNYHWEYFREMDDVRHDKNSNLLIKNPWGYPLAYQCQPGRLLQGVWHRIQLIQEGTRIMGMVDGDIIFDVLDNPSGNTGPVLNSGHIAIRCMWKTKLCVRNLKVYNRLPYTVLQGGNADEQGK